MRDVVGVMAGFREGAKMEAESGEEGGASCEQEQAGRGGKGESAIEGGEGD